MRILTVPEDTAVLRAKSQPVKKIDAELMAFLRDLGKTLKDQKDPAGVGLSAVQVGRPIRAFATLLPMEENNEHPPAGEAGKTMSNGEKTKSKKQKAKIVFYINPEIVSHPNEMTLGEDLVDPPKDRPSSHLGGQERTRPFLEGCLSIPNIYGPVLRWPWIKAVAAVLSEKDLLDISLYRRSDLQLVDVSLNGLAGRVFQHELDHLNGILFTDHVLKQGNRLYQDSGNGMEEVNL